MIEQPPPGRRELPEGLQTVALVGIALTVGSTTAWLLAMGYLVYQLLTRSGG